MWNAPDSGFSLGVSAANCDQTHPGTAKALPTVAIQINAGIPIVRQRTIRIVRILFPRVVHHYSSGRVASLEASSIAIDVGASQFPQLPMLRHSPEQVGGYTATNAWSERYCLREHKDRQECAQEPLSEGQKNYSTVSRDPRQRL